jgi:hypothetical protein
MSRKLGLLVPLAALVAAGALLAAGPASAAGGIVLRSTIVAGPVHVSPGTPVEYNIVAVNLSTVAAHLPSVVVTKPGVFRYQPGSTLGGVCCDPVVKANQLTWTMSDPAGSPIVIPPGGSLEFQFRAITGQRTGWFFARVALTLDDGQIVRSSIEAPVQVVAGG